MATRSRLDHVGQAAPTDVADLARLRTLIDHRPTGGDADRRLVVADQLGPLLGERGLARGSVTVIRGGAGCTSLALALVAGPTTAGSWVACVGAEELGWAAAAELGVELNHLVVVRPSDEAVAEVLAALIDAVDVVLWGTRPAVSHSAARRLHARARERGAALLVVDPLRSAGRGWPGVPDVELVVSELGWSGLSAGWGHLRSRRVQVEVGGRRSPGPPRRVELLLPGPDGRPVAVEAAPAAGSHESARAAVIGLPVDRSA